MRAGVSTTAPARLKRIDPRVAIGAITAFGLLVRLAGTGHTLNHDEGYTWLVGSAPSAGSFLYRLAAYENTPPLYYLLLEGLPLSHEFWVRLPALIAGTALIPVLYALAKPAFGTWVALLAALALAVAPYHVANSDLARGFTLADFALLCAIWAMTRIVSDGAGEEPPARRWLVLYAVA
ncbi:MAG: glycosyltransferase family 39 protein, partial [Solirubrobacteraceae bacterium]